MYSPHVTAADTVLAGADVLVQTSGGLVPRGSRVYIFERIFSVFLLLGTLVGVVVVVYMLYNAYKYRASAVDGDEFEGLRLGELPTGGGSGTKLFLSFAMSAVIVVSLVAWTYLTLLYVEQNPPVEQDDSLEIEVVGYRFAWQFVYPNGHTETGTLRVPEDRAVKLILTSRDVFHTFGIPELKVKSDAIPGTETDTWFVADETGEYTAKCYELCGVGHSQMSARVVVMEQSAYEAWYANTTASDGAANDTSTATTTSTSALASDP
jgi:cytochrome c oxidase subunit 2